MGEISAASEARVWLWWRCSRAVALESSGRLTYVHPLSTHSATAMAHRRMAMRADGTGRPEERTFSGTKTT
jgi:hypothetical protein